jgi:hypothetical protein
MDEEPKQKPLSAQSGFWRRAADHGKLGKTDIFHLRDALLKLEKAVAEAACCDADELMGKLREVQEQLTKDYATQALVMQTMMEILIEKKIMTEDEFVDKLDEIDLRDGVRDGTLHGPGQGK